MRLGSGGWPNSSDALRRRPRARSVCAMPPNSRPPGIQAILDDLATGIPFDSLEAVQQHLARRMEEYNTQPQVELGGLSPDRVAQLLAGDWTSAGALRVADDAPLALLQDVPFLVDARTLLRFVADAAPVKLTPAGNLPRSAVSALVPQLRMAAGNADATGIPVAKVRNEGDVRWLPILRHVLLFARLLVKRKGLVLSKLGRELLDDERAGALYALLFRTFFREFDLRYLYLDARHAALQQTLAYSFYHLSRVAPEWTDSEELASRAWLDSARDPMLEWEARYGDMRHSAFRFRVLEPLVMFGVLEGRLLPGAERWFKRAEYRRTALFERVLRFEFRRRWIGDAFLMG